VRQLSDLIAGRDQTISLDYAALLLSTIECPDLDIEASQRQLDEHAAEIARRTASSDGRRFIAETNHYLFQELEFHGNTDDYYNPGNSCLNRVLTSRTGIPISLSVLYIELARRVNRPVLGIGLPGHFVVRYDDGEYTTYIDSFHRGRLLGVIECIDLARAATKTELVMDGSVLAPVGTRQIITRMINNLRGIYFSRRQHRKALQIVNLLIDADPRSAPEYKQRGLLLMQLGRMSDAREDFERYLNLDPQADDRDEIRKQVLALRKWMAGLN
jgi:regulator of sirC expression with transglutaminase-like and TPR domain